MLARGPVLRRHSRNAESEPYRKVSLPSRRLARRMPGIAAFQVMDLVARAQAMDRMGRDVVHMEVGEPDFPTPAPIVEAGQRALAEGRTRYTAAAGLPQLREALARHYQEHEGVSVEPERILVTPGASGALQVALALLVNPGEQVLLADPGYPCNRNLIRMLGGLPGEIAVGSDTNYQLTRQLAEHHWSEDTAAAMLASPSNPTGTVADPEEVWAIGQLAGSRGGALIVDEIYRGLVYDDATPSALVGDEGAFVINSFSKYFGMTGWRLGWLVTPEGYQREAEKLAQNLFLAPPTPAQYAALAAFTPATMEIVEARRQAFQERRDFLIPVLRELGFGVPVVPAGAFYIYAQCDSLADDSQALAWRMLEEGAVAVTPGGDFGIAQGRRHLRFAYTTSVERLSEAAERIKLVLGAF